MATRSSLFVLTVVGVSLLGAACHKSAARQDAGRLLLVEGTTGNRGIYAQPLDKDKASDLVLGDSVDGIPFDSGTGLIGTRSTTGDGGDQLARLMPGAKQAEAVPCKVDFLSTLFAVDASGKRVLLKKMERGIDHIRFLDTGTCASTDLELRFSYRGDVSPDGTEAVIGGAPISCTDKDVGKCPVTLYRLRLPGAAVPTEVLRGGARANYMPRYAGDRIIFQSSERDTGCDGAINHCRHDLVAIPRAAGPGAPLELVREGAVDAAISPDGKSLGYLAYLGTETDCHATLPCPSMTLKVGPLAAKNDQKDVVIASGRVAAIPPHAFSLDGRYIVFSAQVPGNRRMAEACRTSGDDCQTFGEMRILGWLK
jgi:hypothetical protein